MIKILREYGRAVKFRLGRFVGVKRTSPGILNVTAVARHSSGNFEAKNLFRNKLTNIV